MADTTALKNRIRAAIKSNDNQEITGPVLQQALLDMVDELNGATETEASQRQNGDSTLQQSINTERQQRQNADSTLSGMINSETQQRQDADSTLQQGINTEKQQRQEADAALDAALRQRITDEILQEKNRAEGVETIFNERISVVEQAISESEVPYGFTESGYIRVSDGQIQETPRGGHTVYISLTGRSTLEVKTYISNLGYAVAFYDINNNLLTDISIAGNGSTNIHTIDLTQSQYENAAYAVACVFTSSGDFTGFYAKTISQDGEIVQKIKNEETARQNADNSLDERLSVVEQAISESEEINHNLSESGYLKTDGTIYPTQNGAHTNHINLGNCAVLKVKTTNSNLGYAVAFYDLNDNLLTDISIIGSGSTDTSIDLTQSQYENAAYAVVSAYNQNQDFTRYYAKTVSQDGEIVQKIKDEEKILSEITEKSLGISGFAKPIYDYNVVLVYGQSLAAGQQTCPPLSTINYKGNLMIGKEWADGNSLNSMVAECPNYTQEQAEAAQKSDQEKAESPGINLCNALKYMIDDACMQTVDRKVLIVNAAIGGQSIELLLMQLEKPLDALE